DLTMALALQKDDPTYLSQRAHLYLETEDYRAALYDYDRLMELRVHTPANLLGRARTLVQLGDHESATRMVEALKPADLTPVQLHAAAAVYARAVSCLDGTRRVASEGKHIQLRSMYQEKAILA